MWMGLAAYMIYYTNFFKVITIHPLVQPHLLRNHMHRLSRIHHHNPLRYLHRPPKPEDRGLRSQPSPDRHSNRRGYLRGSPHCLLRSMGLVHSITATRNAIRPGNVRRFYAKRRVRIIVFHSDHSRRNNVAQMDPSRRTFALV